MNDTRHSWLRRLAQMLARHPLPGFLLLGGLLYAADAHWLTSSTPQAQILIEAPRVDRLRQQWTQKLGRAPTDVEMSTVLEDVVLEDMLIAEAIARGWHRNDHVILRRMKQNLEFLGMSSDEDALETAYNLDLHRRDPVMRKRLRLLMESALLAGAPAATPTAETTPPEPVLKLSFSHIFRKDEIKPAELALLKNASPEEAAELSDPFLKAHHFRQVNLSNIAREFGPGFAREVNTMPTGRWVGPLRSAYGQHLVRVAERKHVVPALDQNRTRIARQIESEQQRLELALADLRGRYRWDVEKRGEEQQ